MKFYLDNISKILLTAFLLLMTEQLIYSLDNEWSDFPAPEIKSLQAQCFNEEVTLRIKPVGYTEADRVWEYGVFGDAWQAVSEFTTFLNNIDSYLKELYPCSVHCESCDPGKISSAIYGTDYHFMNESYMLYADLAANKGEIANQLLQGIEEQYLGYLSNEERAYLSSFFSPAAMQVSYWIPAYMPVVSTWSPLGSVKADEINFKASFITPVRSDLVTLAFRVRLISGSDFGPYSRVQLTDIKPKPPSFIVTKQPSCPNRPTGEISINVTESQLAEMSFKCVAAINGAGPAGTFTGSVYTFSDKFDSGVYTVKVYYNNDILGGCSDTTHVFVRKTPDLTFDSTPKDASCPEKADGSISVGLLSSSGGHKFKLNSAEITQPNGVFTSLDNGTYTIEVTDVCYITAKTRNITVGEPPEIAISGLSIAEPTCHSDPDGELKISITGGTSQFSYQLLNEVSSVIGSANSPDRSCTFSKLPGGTYRIMARQGECAWKTSESRTLAAVTPVNFNAAVTNVDCYGKNTGGIKISASGGNNNYKYSINNNSLVTTPEFTSLLSGMYQITVQSTASACNDIITGMVTVGTAPKIEITFPEHVNPSCFEKNDGSITANVTGGTGGYMYTWTSNKMSFPNHDSNKITSLISDIYSLTVTDIKNCTESKYTQLTDPPELIVQSATPFDAACFGGEGSILVQASGGTGVYQYSTSENSGFAISSQIIVPAGDHYVYVKDANGCKAAYGDLITVTEPATPLDFTFISAKYNGFDVPCHGDASGAVSIQASGGNGLKHDGSEYEGYVYSVAGSPDRGEPDFTGLLAGNNTVKVTDGRGCTVTKTAILTQPDPVSLDLLSIDPVKCFGASTGKISVSANGGIANTYKYKLNEAEVLSVGVFENLPADNYEIEVSDINGCTNSLFATVASINPPIEISMVQKDVRCFGEVNGEINTTVTGGAGGFSYTWEKKTAANWLPESGNTGSRINVAPGIYRVKATDAESCYEYGIAEISEPAMLKLSDVSSADVVCSGDNGKISLSAIGGTTVYTYICSADNGTIYTSNNPEFSLPEGLYSASVSDRNGCMVVYPLPLRITSPDSPLDFTSVVSSYNGYSVSCNGKSDGSIVVNPAGGNGAAYSGYLFSLSGNPETSVNNFTELSSGSYDVKVTDGRGCSIQKTVVLTQPQPVTINLVGTMNVKCFGETTGEIAVLTGGGVPGTYFYKLNGSDVSSEGVFSRLAAGNYVVGVSDKNGCSGSLAANIAHLNPPISTSIIPVSVRCYGESSGELSAVVAGGSGGFTYTWETKSPGGWQNAGQGINISNLKAGLYRLRSTDSNLCFRIDTAEVKEPQPLRISKVTSHDATCYGDQGSIEIEATGGNSGYSFQYTPNNNRIFYHDYTSGSPIAPGIYGLKVTDSKGCNAEGSGIYNVTMPPTPLTLLSELSKFGDYNVSCHGNNDGWIRALASGGNGFDYSGYTYRLSGYESQAGNLFPGLEAGSFDLAVTDGRGCTLTKSIVLNQPESKITLKAASLKKPLCVYDSNGVITLSAQGGSLPYEFSVNGGNYSHSAEFTSLPVNSYSFKVRDLNGCAESFDTVLQSQISEMKISGVIGNVKCFGESSGSVNITVSGGTKPFSYLWKENGLHSALATNLSTGKYTVQVTDSAGCRFEKDFIVSQPEKPLSLFVKGSPACVGLKDGEITTLPQGGTPPYRFDLNRKSDFLMPSVFNVYSGNHTVYVADRNDCTSESRIFIDVRNTMPDINFMLATSRYELDTLVVIDVSVPPPDRVTWEFSPDAVVIDTTKNKASVRYNQAGLYPVKMTGLFGTCAYTIEKLLNIAPFDPSVAWDNKDRKGIKSVKISPNPNDGTFELLVGLHTKQQVTVKVFDLYSRLVFQEILPPDILFVKEISLPETVMPGTYILRVTAENDSRSSMFVISE